MREGGSVLGGDDHDTREGGIIVEHVAYTTLPGDVEAGEGHTKFVDETFPNRFGAFAGEDLVDLGRSGGLVGVTYDHEFSILGSILDGLGAHVELGSVGLGELGYIDGEVDEIVGTDELNDSAVDVLTVGEVALEFLVLGHEVVDLGAEVVDGLVVILIYGDNLLLVVEAAGSELVGHAHGEREESLELGVAHATVEVVVESSGAELGVDVIT